MIETDYLESGKQAMAVGDWELARAQLTCAEEKQPSAAVFEELGWACWWLNDIPAASTYRTRAYHGYLDQQDYRGASRNASWLGLDCMEFKGEFAVANGWFQHAERLLEGTDPCPELCLIRTLKANMVFRVEKDPDRALAQLDEVIGLSQTIHDAESLMMAEGLKGTLLVILGRVREGMGLLDEATVMALQDETLAIHSVTTACCFLIDACQRIRDFERAGQWCNKVKEICRRWHHRAVFATCRVQYAAVLIWRGDWTEAEHELVVAKSELEQYKPAGINACLLRLADLRRRQGRWTEAATLLDQVGQHWLKALARAELAYDRGEFREALEGMEKFLRQMPLHEKTERVAGLDLQIRAAVQVNDISCAEKALVELIGIANAIDTMPLRAARLHAEGVLLQATHDLSQSQRKLEDSIALYDELQSPFEAARSRVALASTLQAAGKTDAGKSELTKAISIFKSLHASRDMEKAKEMLKRQPDESHPALGLTEREVAVLKLLAAGKNNEEIGNALYVSVRTVEKHITNIYLKLGVSGKSARAFAASFAEKHNLTAR